MRKTSKVANGWWDYTTLPDDLLSDAARLTARDLQQLTRPGFEVVIYDSLDWAFNDPPRREGAWIDAPPSPAQYRQLSARMVDLHPMTIIQHARTSGGGVVSAIPSQALSVGPVETWKSDQVSIWHAGAHDNPFGMRLTALMISKRIADSSVPMSLLAQHDRVKFSFYRRAIGTCEAEMH